MKIHVTTGATGPGAWTHQRDKLWELFSQSRVKAHEWVGTPQEADVIFLCNVMQPGKSDISDHPVLRAYREKTFVLSEQWQPPFNAAGIYANAPRKLGWRQRFRTGSYALHHQDFKNKLVDAFEPSQMLPPEKRDLLASFLGRDCHPVRAKIFAAGTTRPDILIEDTSWFDAFSHGQDRKADAQARYFDICLRSRYLLCPRGAGPNSIRLFEALKMGIAPVIIADDFILPSGVDWPSFAIFIKERDAADWIRIVAQHENEFLERGKNAREAHLRFFAPDVYFNYLVENALSIKAARVLPERVFAAVDRLMERVGRLDQKVRRRLKLRRPAQPAQA
ncbi:MAG TPA: exostosin family protein [Opitutaceae bacterium]|nr:exostosin family protein [Opitutaceae bacterium]